MPSARTVLGTIGAAALLSAIPLGGAASRERPADTLSPAALAARGLILHNAERHRVGVAPLVWSAPLAEEARVYAAQLARRGALVHSSAGSRPGQGENLWMGTAGAYTLDEMIGMFAAERRHFRNNPFPNVSTTGRWEDVGHYTQMVWRATREVGCAIARRGGNDVLVCRYRTAGNVVGQRAY